MRTTKEIKAEIKALRKLKPVLPFAQKTTRSIELAIEELENGYDDTSEEWNELSDDQQDIIYSTRRWKEGVSENKPSWEWGGLVK